MNLHLAVLLLSVTALTTARPTIRHRRDVVTEASATAFLQRYQYLPETSDKFIASVQQDQVVIALRKYQKMMGIPETGVLDASTKAEMANPRCGNSDVNMMKDARRRRRYVLLGDKWSKKHLTYRVTRYTPHLSTAEVDDTIAKSFKMWQDVSSLTFQRVTSGTPDIEIVFTTGQHDRPGDTFSGELAHAYSPEDGDAHFNDQFTWTLNTNGGINLLQVAVHEFGHSLGLDHSRVQSSIMWPSYNDYIPNFQLDQDDINGIQSLYPTDGQPPSPPATSPPDTPDETTTSWDDGATTPSGGDDNTTPWLGDDTTPSWGDNTTPSWGDDNTTPSWGNDNTTPSWGDDNTTPSWGDDNTTPSWGDDNTTPSWGDDNTTPSWGGGETTPWWSDDDTTSSDDGWWWSRK